MKKKVLRTWHVQKDANGRYSLWAVKMKKQNKTRMETITGTTASIEIAKTNMEIGVITKSGELDNECKRLELGLQIFSTYKFF
jgi:hypothetical protein